MENNRSKLIRNILGVVLVLAILAFITFIYINIRNQVNTTIAPIQQANSALSTQVSNLLHPTPTILPDPVTIIREIQSLARLETIQYTVEKVITAESNQGIFGSLFGDKLLLVAHGQVIAGIDLNRIASNDLWLEGDVLMVRLPDAEIFSATLDNQQSYIYDRTTGIFTNGDPQLETSARQAAEQEILKAAETDGILEMARVNAEVYLERLFNTLGYLKVSFIE